MTDQERKGWKWGFLLAMDELYDHMDTLDDEDIQPPEELGYLIYDLRKFKTRVLENLKVG